MPEYEEDDYEGQPESALVPAPPQVTPSAMTMTLAGFDAEALTTQVLNLAASNIVARVEGAKVEALQKVLRAEIERAARGTVEAVVREHVERVLAEGWQPTDQWGDPRGPRVTLRQRIETILAEKTTVGDYDNRREETLVDRLTRGHIENVFSNEFRAAVSDATTKFRALVDQTVKGKLTDALKAALNL